MPGHLVFYSTTMDTLDHVERIGAPTTQSRVVRVLRRIGLRQNVDISICVKHDMRELDVPSELAYFSNRYTSRGVESINSDIVISRIYSSRNREEDKIINIHNAWKMLWKRIILSIRKRKIQLHLIEKLASHI